MKKIKLTQDKFALVDDADYGWLNQFAWYVIKSRNTFYACRDIHKDKILRMHRLIMGLDFGDKRQSDHINGNGLDNRRSNLRICTNQQNQFNQEPRIGSSKYKGVHWHKRDNKWQAQIRIDSNPKHLGLYDNEEDAALAYNLAAQEHYGEYARINIIPSLGGE